MRHSSRSPTFAELKLFKHILGMKWIDNTELMTLLQRFDMEVEARLHLGCGVCASHWWHYDGDGFYVERLGESSRCLTESKIRQLYPNAHWSIVPFYFIEGKKERQLAVRLVEELVTLGHLDEILSEYEVEDVRICEHCHRLMAEGWLVDDMLTFCSDKCLKAGMPDADLADLKAHACEDGSSVYWTRWEG